MLIRGDQIPAELKDRPQWVVWRYEEREGKRTKVPYCVSTGEKASSTDPATWTAFEAAEVCHRRGKMDGVGFVFTADDPYVGIDLDQCRNPESGELTAEAQEWLDLLDSYTEVTPSGAGVHVICRGSLPGSGRKGPWVEMYEKGRYFTMTGDRLAGSRPDAASREMALRLMYGALFPPKPKPSVSVPLNGTQGDDAAILDKALREGRYVALWRGDWSAYPSQSEADLALIGRLAFFTGPNPPTIDRLFRQSGLMREKWDDPGHGHAGSTYGIDTIETALEGKQEFYQWRTAPSPSSNGTRNEATAGQDPSFASFASLACSQTKTVPPSELESEALSGLAGEIVSAIDPHTESHPAAVLASLLVGIGCLIGGRPCVYRDAGRLTANEFVVLVGLSAKGRKGTATRRVEEILKRISDSDSNNWLHEHMHEREGEESLYETLRLSGLGSGEAMVEALADKESDRRRIIIEEEFSRCLKVMRREGSTLSEALRAAWDGGILANRTKGKHLRARDTHVSILAHITEEELKAELSGPALYNGFANRFLWICCARSKSLPLGGGRLSVSPLVHRLQQTLNFARKAEAMEFDEDAKAVWTPPGEIYDRLVERPPGLLGAVTSRAEAHVSRLAMIYALLDLDREIKLRHLLAALAFWDFSEKSCAYLFGLSSGDDTADRIEEALWSASPGALSLREIHDLFHRHARAGAIRGALSLLVSQRKVERRSLSTPGRPVELWSISSASDCEQSERSELTPLQRARELAAALASKAKEAN